MEKEPQEMNEHQSLVIIQSMIESAKGRIQDNSFHFLLWGWVVVTANIGFYYLINFTTYEAPYMIWLITLPAAVIASVYGYRQDKAALVTTYADKISFWTWMSFVISILIVIFFGSKINYQINPVILTMAAFATFLTGVILKFVPLKAGGVFLWASAVACFLVEVQYQPLVAAIGVSGGYLVPGYLLRKKGADDV